MVGTEGMCVTKRDGSREALCLQQIQDKIATLGCDLSVDVGRVALRVCDSLVDGIHTAHIDEIAAEVAMEFYTTHTDYERLAVRILVDNMHRVCPPAFAACVRQLYEDGRVSDEFYTACRGAEVFLESLIDRTADARLSFFGLKTLINNRYLLRTQHDSLCELPCYMWMRVVVGVFGNNVEDNRTAIRDCYMLLSDRMYTHATPTLFNSGTGNPQFASCFLLALNEDSIEGIYESLGEAAKISKHAGGIGIHMHNLRATGSIISSTGCKTEGLIPTLRVFNESSLLVKQAGKRPGSIAIYLSPDHLDVEKFIDMRRNHGDDREHCRDLFSALWIPDKFMRAVTNDEVWHMFSPDTSPGLADVWGDEYDVLYDRYVAEGRHHKTIRARDLWQRIISAQIETGTPYLLYKDSVNLHNNQKNIGVIKSSNLCTEITEVSTPREIAVCNLASICLSRFFIKPFPSPANPDTAHNEDKLADTLSACVDFDGLRHTTATVVRALNSVIDTTFYPVEKARVSNLRHRPLGVGVQGWATLLFKLKLEFDSDAAYRLNKMIFAHIYFAAWSESAVLARIHGAYDSFEGSPLQAGVLHADTWSDELEQGLDWTTLRAQVRQGVRNSLITAIMPTASTAQICNNTECIEPQTSNLYVRRTQAGEFQQVNQYLVKDLEELGLWSLRTKDAIIANEGSVAKISGIPDEIKNRYKTAYELSQKVIIRQARDRSPYIDQSQSMNLFLCDPRPEQVSSMHLFAWKAGLKTGQYYLRSRPRARPTQFTIEKHPPVHREKRVTCDGEVCESCSA
jgi:ribonucleoside-diphosphate reductase alpha chain